MIGRQARDRRGFGPNSLIFRGIATVSRPNPPKYIVIYLVISTARATRVVLFSEVSVCMFVRLFVCLST